jgi:hypothetical protein
MSDDQITRHKMGKACREEKCIQSFSGKPEGKGTFGRPRCRWEKYGGRLIGFIWFNRVTSVGLL